MTLDTATPPCWFVTGASSGLGRALALAILARGWRCIAAVRNPGDVAQLSADFPDTMLALKMDVTDPAQVDAAIVAALSWTSAIDVLVNNAGRGFLAAVEEAEEGDLRSLFDTNFFGLASVTRAVLPHMRARRSGMIVNISSLAGLRALPASGCYAASKFAVEGLSEALAAEVAPLGIGVLIVEPGPFRTDWAGRSMRGSATQIGDYRATAGVRRTAVTQASGCQSGDPAKAADAVIAATLTPDRPLRLLLGDNASAVLRQKIAELEADIVRSYRIAPDVTFSREALSA